MPWTLPVVVMLIVAALRGASGGTLADAAFYESIRRAFTPPATRSLTMADLPAAAPGTVVPEPPAKPEETPAKALEPPAKPDEPPAKSPELSESDWRARMTAVREALERDQVLAEGLQSRVNALTTESIGRDDPAARAELIKQRSRALVELDRLTLQIEKDKLAIAAIEEDARKKGIPPGWIR